MDEHNPLLDRLWSAAVVATTFCLALAPTLYGQASIQPHSVDAPAPSDVAYDSVNSVEQTPHTLAIPNALGVWVGGSVHTGRLLGNLQSGRLGIVALRYSRRLIPRSSPPTGSEPGLHVRYTFDVIPASWLVIPKGTGPGTLSPLRSSLRQTGLSTFGVGSYPFGLQFHLRPEADIQPFVAGQAGILYFLDAVPDSRGNHVNFAAGFGGGVRIRLRTTTALVLGYRYHHLSNGFRAAINPGLDGNFLYLGVNFAP